MKTLKLFPVFLLCSMWLWGQDIVIGHASMSGVEIPLTDTALTSFVNGYCGTTTYLLDIDRDSVDDIEFYLDCYMGGQGSYKNMKITTFNNFIVHMDSNYMHYHQYYENYQVHDTVTRATVVKKYARGDTIRVDEYALGGTSTMLKISQGNDPLCQYNNINLFVGDTSYIAFTKTSGNDARIYYIKIHIPSPYYLHLISAKTNEATATDEKEMMTDLLFPNPATGRVYLRGAYDVAEVYSMQGTLLLRQALDETNNFIDVSAIRPGHYIVRLKKDRNEATVKFIKL
jgi:hypothetical protein